MDPVKRKLWSDLLEVFSGFWPRSEAGRAEPETFCASADAQSGNDAGLCYFHLN